MDHLSEDARKDLVERLRPPGGGFTFSVRTGRHAPARGYAVSIEGAEESHPPGTEVTEEHLAHYAAINEEHLRRRGRYMGGWHSPQDPQSTDLDVSQRFDDPQLASSKMMAEGQRAMYNLKTGESMYNPLHSMHGQGLISPEGYANLRRGFAKDPRGFARKMLGAGT